MTAALLAQTDNVICNSSATNEIDINETGVNIWGDNVEKLVGDGIVSRPTLLKS